MIAALFFNVHKGKGAKKMQPLDFFEGDQKSSGHTDGIRPSEVILTEMARWVNAVESGKKRKT